MPAKKANPSSPPSKSSARQLTEYATKRHLDDTSEPQAIVPARARRGNPAFVIHQHVSRTPHFDLRLEMNGVLKSWAVPQGLPVQSGEKRLAIQVEDHPLRYAQFQGVIPPGNYGAGTVSIWDKGDYETGGEDPLSAWKSGKLRVRLHGGRLQGTWTLVRMDSSPEIKKNWLLLKSETPADAPGATAESLPRKKAPARTERSTTEEQPRFDSANRSQQPRKARNS